MSYYNRNEISNSAIGYYLESPFKLKKYLDGKLEDAESSALDNGKLIHAFFLEPDVFHNNYIKIDLSIPQGKMTDFIRKIVELEQSLKKEGYEFTWEEKDLLRLKEEVGFSWSFPRVWQEFQKTDNQQLYSILTGLYGKEIYGEDEEKMLNRLKENILQHKGANEIINAEEKDGKTIFNEIEIYWEYKNGIKCKAKIDKIIVDSTNLTVTVVELKSTSKPLRYFEHEIKKYAYYRQIAFYLKEALKALEKEHNLDFSLFKIQHKFVVLETRGLNLVRVVDLDESNIIQGEIEYSTCLDQIKWHIDNDFWFKREYKDSNDWTDHIDCFND